MALVVTLGGSDISARLVGAVSVARQERIAGTARFSFSPSGAPGLPTDMIRKAVTITEGGSRIFTGSVVRAEWDMKARVFAVSCSDLLQEQFEGQTDAAIAALLPGSRYSERLFGQREDGWQYCLDRMSTVPLDVHLDRSGSLQAVAWTAKTTPDRTLTAAEILNDGAYQLDLINGREIITRYLITYQYRVTRWHAREHHFNFTFTRPGDYTTPFTTGADMAPDTWCDWAINFGFIMPTREVIQEAAAGCGWPVVGGISYVGHPASGAYCPPTGGGAPLVNWVNNAGLQYDETDTLAADAGDQQAAITAYWDGMRHWAQTVTETYSITVESTAAQALFGLKAQEDNAAYQVPADDQAFEGGGLARAEYQAWGQDAIGDYVTDRDDETGRDNDIQTLMAVADTRMRDQLRRNYVTVSTEILPTLELAETVAINTADIQAKGKVQSIEHSITGAAATTTIRIAISRGGGGTGDTLTTPARPDTGPTHTAPATLTNLGVNIGGCSDSEVYDEDWMGWSTIVPQAIGAATRPLCSSPGDEPAADQLYPTTMKVPGPDIEDEARNEVTATQTASYDIAVPDDTLVLT